MKTLSSPRQPRERTMTARDLNWLRRLTLVLAVSLRPLSPFQFFDGLMGLGTKPPPQFGQTLSWFGSISQRWVLARALYVGRFSEESAHRKHTNEMKSSGSLNHVQNVQLATLADSAAEGGESRGTC